MLGLRRVVRRDNRWSEGVQEESAIPLDLAGMFVPSPGSGAGVPLGAGYFPMSPLSAPSGQFPEVMALLERQGREEGHATGCRRSSGGEKSLVQDPGQWQEALKDLGVMSGEPEELQYSTRKQKTSGSGDKARGSMGGVNWVGEAPVG
ncbi:hypothetical protein NDU88_010728 [Pleurodeles waltl]|uniref:Uncharacterized protein n=1 Tax=Pleurodeles waltl TaxID=8319 RepID=A0AAV7S224_PLEWA|nr:hypothetical protein NDU88_010728 [Pleurodeles waltl]